MKFWNHNHHRGVPFFRKGSREISLSKNDQNHKNSRYRRNTVTLISFRIESFESSFCHIFRNVVDECRRQNIWMQKWQSHHINFIKIVTECYCKLNNELLHLWMQHLIKIKYECKVNNETKHLSAQTFLMQTNYDCNLLQSFSALW